MIVDVVLDILETHSRSVPKKMMEELMIYVLARNVVQMQFVILDSVYVLLALKGMIHTMLQLDVQPSPNVLTTRIVDTMRSVQRFRTVILDNVLMHVAELLAVPTPFAWPTTIIEHAFVTKDIPVIQMMYKLGVPRK